MNTLEANDQALLPDSLFRSIETILTAEPAGIKEYDLIQQLQKQGYFGFLDRKPALAPDMFRAHFILFHALYLLQDKLLASHDQWLEISVLNIQLHPGSQGNGNIGQHDEVRNFYLDLANLEDTSEDDVYELIASFWKNMARDAGREEALSTLGLSDPVDRDTIRKQYRRLAMQHHPDRGGNKARLQEINIAAGILLDN